ncbi:MAG: hypothetical protein ACI9EF_002489 [Pseudohongiellaceae bacterium]|jgi:hypothetical protein
MSPSEAMVQEILARSASAGRDKLGELAYQMARTCFMQIDSASDVASRVFEEPRSVVDINADLSHLRARTGLQFETSKLPLAAPSESTASKATMACLRVAESIEGPTSRVQFLKGRTAQAVDNVEHADRVFSRMLASPLSRTWINHVQEHLQTVAIGAGRFDQVLNLGDAVLRRSPSSLTCLFNVAIACAELHDERRFDSTCRQFRQSTEAHDDAAWWLALINEKASWFAGVIGRDPERIKASLISLGSTGGCT